MHLLAVEGVQEESARAEPVDEVLAGARAAALADHQHVLLGDPGLGCRDVEALGHQPDRRRLRVRQVEQPVLDVGDPDVARAAGRPRSPARRATSRSMPAPNSASCISSGSFRYWRLWMVTTCWRRTLPCVSSFQTTPEPRRVQRPS